MEGSLGRSQRGKVALKKNKINQKRFHVALRRVGQAHKGLLDLGAQMLCRRNV